MKKLLALILLGLMVGGCINMRYATPSARGYECILEPWERWGSECPL